MDSMVFVCRTVEDAFLSVCPYSGQAKILYNTNETDKILKMASGKAELPGAGFRWCGVGKLAPIKGFDRMIRIQKRLTDEGYNTHFYALGEGKQRAELEAMVSTVPGERLSISCVGIDASVSDEKVRLFLSLCRELLGKEN
jgi:glycosyltransferase involved in cell wall biosynthesis